MQLQAVFSKVNSLPNLMWIIKPIQVNVFDLGSINCKTKRFRYNSLSFMSLSLTNVPKVGHRTQVKINQLAKNRTKILKFLLCLWIINRAIERLCVPGVKL